MDTGDGNDHTLNFGEGIFKKFISCKNVDSTIAGISTTRVGSVRLSPKSSS